MLQNQERRENINSRVLDRVGSWKVIKKLYNEQSERQWP